MSNHGQLDRPQYPPVPQHVKPPSVAFTAASCMTGAERSWWVVVNIFMLGYPWWRKTVMKRAFIEALEAHGRLYRPPAPYPVPAETQQRGPYMA